MASKRGLSSVLGVTDIAHLMDAFQQLNGVILSMSFEVIARTGIPDLVVTATAYTVESASAGRVPLVSFRSSLSALNCATFEGAAMQCLYRLDGLMAAKEMKADQPR